MAREVGLRLGHALTSGPAPAAARLRLGRALRFPGSGGWGWDEAREAGLRLGPAPASGPAPGSAVSAAEARARAPVPWKWRLGLGRGARGGASPRPRPRQRGDWGSGARSSAGEAAAAGAGAGAGAGRGGASGGAGRGGAGRGRRHCGPAARAAPARASAPSLLPAPSALLCCRPPRASPRARGSPSCRPPRRRGRLQALSRAAVSRRVRRGGGAGPRGRAGGRAGAGLCRGRRRRWPRGDDARVQSGGAGLGRGGQIRPDGAVRDRHVHREVRPHHRGLLPQGDRGGLVAVRAGDPGHGGHRAVRLHAGPVHQERPGLHPRLQPGQPAELPGHQAHARPDHPREAV